jgi:excisionase family DNA binding protein
MLSTMHNKEPFIGAAESCQLLDCHAATLGRWVKNGTIAPAHKLPGKNGAYLFRRADVEELAAKRAAERAEQSA